MWGIEMDFEALRCFITVAETLNFRRASEQLFLSQPALSRKIAELEKALGAALLERDTRNVRLTPAGRACLGHARRILQDCAAMQAQVADIRRGIMGELMIGYHGRGNVPYLSAAIGRCMAQYPQIRINAALLETERLRQDLLAEEIDGVMILAPCIWDLQEMEHICHREGAPSVLLPAGHPLAGWRLLSSRTCGRSPLSSTSGRSPPTCSTPCSACVPGRGLLPISPLPGTTMCPCLWPPARAWDSIPRPSTASLRSHGHGPHPPHGGIPRL